MFFLAAGIYGLFLSAMIFSMLLTPAVIGLFVSEPFTLGSHGVDWAYWHGISCAFVGIVSLMARNWPRTVWPGMAMALCFVYGVWGLQNLRLVLATDGYTGLMWGHVTLCLAVGVWGAATAYRLRGAGGFATVREA